MRPSRSAKIHYSHLYPKIGIVNASVRGNVNVNGSGSGNSNVNERSGSKRKIKNSRIASASNKGRINGLWQSPLSLRLQIRTPPLNR
jgi:hypothetical protein